MNDEDEILKRCAKVMNKTNWQSKYSPMDSGGVPYWNPLNNLLHAAEMAVQLGISVHWNKHTGTVTAGIAIEKDGEPPKAIGWICIGNDSGVKAYCYVVCKVVSQMLGDN